jgi:hypothetical protein
VDETKTTGVPFDSATLEFALRKTLERMAERLREQPLNSEALNRLSDAVHMARALPFEVTLWRVQNVYYSLMQAVYPEALRRAAAGDPDAAARAGNFRSLGERLSVRVQ